MFTYVDSTGKETLLKERAAVNIDEIQGSLQFLIKSKLVDLIHSGYQYTFEYSQ